VFDPHPTRAGPAPQERGAQAPESRPLSGLDAAQPGLSSIGAGPVGICPRAASGAAGRCGLRLVEAPGETIFFPPEQVPRAGNPNHPADCELVRQHRALRPARRPRPAIRGAAVSNFNLLGPPRTTKLIAEFDSGPSQHEHGGLFFPYVLHASASTTRSSRMRWPLRPRPLPHRSSMSAPVGRVFHRGFSQTPKPRKPPH